MDFNKLQCQTCGDEITWRMASVSRGRFRKSLCLDCQAAEIEATYPPKLKDFALKNLEKYRSQHGFG